MKKAIVVGSGAGGAAIAHKLQGSFQVTILEEGGDFRPFPFSLAALEKLKKTGLFFDEREIQLLFPNMRVRKTPERMVLVRGRGLGGTTTLSAGNGLRCDEDLWDLGICLDEEFAELYRDIPVTWDHQDKWQESTRRLFNICREMDLNPQPIPKLGDYSRCSRCGRCVLGCPNGVKWDSRHYLRAAAAKGAEIVTGCRVLRVTAENGLARGVETDRGFYPADVVVIAAGGFNTPRLLEESGIRCASRLFVDPVLCVAAEVKGSRQNREISMPFAVQREDYIISPYFDYLSFFFNRNWRSPAQDTLSLMVKLADTEQGSVHQDGVEKILTDRDQVKLLEGVETCREILDRYGVKKDKIYLGTVNAGHPGGTMPLTRREAATFHHPDLPSNLYLADATLLPRSLGNPPILTIMAMAKRVGKIIIDDLA